jgi:hypothetical protein
MCEMYMYVCVCVCVYVGGFLLNSFLHALVFLQVCNIMLDGNRPHSHSYWSSNWYVENSSKLICYKVL